MSKARTLPRVSDGLAVSLRTCRTDAQVVWVRTLVLLQAAPIGSPRQRKAMQAERKAWEAMMSEGVDQ